MAYQLDKDGTIVISGWDQGIAPSPHKGIGSLKGINITTEPAEVMANYARVQQSQTPISNSAGTLAASVSSGSFYLATNPALQVGTWISITSSTITSLGNGNYYVSYKSNGLIQLSAAFDPSHSNAISHGTSGTASFNTYINMGIPVQAATETYVDTNNNTQYRYYVLDNTGYVWVYDTLVFASSLFISGTGTTWFLPNSVTPTGTAITNATGLAVFSGYIHVFIGSRIYVQETVTLGFNNSGNSTTSDNGWDAFTGGSLNSLYNSSNSHFALVTQNNTLTYCDGAFLGTIETSSNSGSAATVPIWSYGSYTASSTTLTVTDQIGGSNLINGSTITLTSTGTVYSGASVTTLYYVVGANISGTATTFSIAATVGGSPISLSGGSGTQYFNTYKPSHSSGDTTYLFVPQALSLPFIAVSQSLCEIGNTVVVGTQSNFLYFWDEISPLASSFLPLPENNVKYMINVNNMAYIFAGSKGNIYVTNGSTASLVLTVPDYVAGQIEPYFVWGGAAYIRGRVYFSLQDQNSSHTGQCGGIWSFVPTQNFYIGQDVGLGLRIENQNSYGTYNGMANVILNSQNQNANGAQYWAAWTSSISSPIYGIDFSDTANLSQGIIETDLIPTGIYTDPGNYAGIEIKLAAPLVSGETVQVFYRLNLSFGAFTNVGTLNFGDTTNNLSTRFVVPFANSQWVQFQVKLNPITASSSSFVRLSEMRVYKRA